MPWQTADEAIDARTKFDGWRMSQNRILKTITDYDDWQSHYLGKKAVAARGLQLRSDGPGGVLKRQFLRALVRGEWGLSMDGWTYQEVAAWLTSRGYETSTNDVKNAARSNAKLIERCVPRNESVNQLVSIIMSEFPDFQVDQVFAV